MATLIALVYPDVATAEQAAATASGLAQAGYLNILDSSVITKDANGKLQHHGERHGVRTGAVTGAVLGGLTGALFLIPVAGLAAGVALGAVYGKATSPGAANDFENFRDQVSSDLQPGGAAFVVLGETNAVDRVVNDLGRHGGTLRSTDLTSDQIAAFQAEIAKVSAS
jgi:uncharacterized membrane protein